MGFFAMGYAHEVWVSRPENPASKLENLGIRFVGEEEYNREILGLANAWAGLPVRPHSQ